MIFTAPLQPGTSLANVVYKWLVNGAFLAPSASGLTQPDASFPLFRIDTGAVAPTGAEELIVYDQTDVTNWNPAGYRAGLTALAAAQQVLLTSLYVPSPTAPVTIVPASSAQDSICRCFGTFTNLMNVVKDGTEIDFTLVQQDPVDPTIFSDQSGVLIYNKETGALVSDRLIAATIVAGALTDLNGNPWQDLTRTDYMLDATGAAIPRLRYILTCPAIGAQVGLNLLTSSGPTTFSPVAFTLDTSNIAQSSGGTLDVSKVKPN